ncbi:MULTISPECIES: SAM-dependent methyltransferase [unclassified Streptomyces]|uniref:SAM-dependent methyltransferase n=1 Tax=unclassified Streptomyces TaxID=2593676 RepID=UPI00340911E9
MPENGWPADRIDTENAHSARIYDYILGGKDYYPSDKEAGDAMSREWPALPIHMKANRDWMNRAVAWLAKEAGIRQFLDIGTGIPTSPNLHEIAQSVAPESRVVYVDNDPIVLTLSQGLLASTPEGRTAYIEADFQHPEAVLDSPEFRETLDLGKPVALTVIAIVHFVLDEDDAVGIVRRLLEPLPSGSYLAMSIGTAEFAPEDVGRVAREYAARNMPMRLRTIDEADQFFEGLELVEPGIVQVHKWHPDAASGEGIRDEDIAMYGAVARKP